MFQNNNRKLYDVWEHEKSVERKRGFCCCLETQVYCFIPVRTEHFTQNISLIVVSSCGTYLVL